MVTRWLHLVMRDDDPWILLIWNAANAAAQAGRVQPLTDELVDLGLHVSIRLNLLPRIAQRIIQETSDLYKAAKEHGPEHVFTQTVQGYAFPVNNDLKYRLIADIDALLFEVNACWEIMRKLFQLVRAHVGNPIAAAKGAVADELRTALGGASDQWFRWLDKNRNFVAHEGTPYLAIALTDDGTWELLVTKGNIVKFDDPEKFFRYSEMGDVARGFSGAKQALQTHLIDLFRQAGAPNPL